jgi:hypothetical protein
MSETAVDDASNAALLDGDQPRLGAQPMLPNLPTTGDASPAAPALPVVSPVLTSESTPVIPSLPTLPTTPSVTPAPAPAVVQDAPALPSTDVAAALGLDAPTLPAPKPAAPTPAIPAELVDAVVAGEPEPRAHPMAHLMPEKTKPSEASLRAAELRAAKKAKARKVKIIVSIVAIAVAALVGPPLVRWLVDAVNEAGSTKQEEPAPATDEADTKDAEPATGPAAGLEAIEDAERLTGATDDAP